MFACSRDFRFAALCAQWPGHAATFGEIRRAAQTADWEAFSKIVRRHRIGALACATLERAGVEAPAALREAARNSAFRALRHTAEILRLQAAAAKDGIAVVFLKGPPLAQEAFGDIGLRHSKDIDLIVAPSDRERIWALMDREGYRRTMPGPGISPEQLRLFVSRAKDSTFRHPVTGVEVEVHWRMSTSLVEEARSPARAMTLNGLGEVSVLQEDDLFVYLCRHGGRHAWMRLKWLGDIGALINATPDASERYWRVAKAAGAELAVEVAMRLSARLLDTRLPDVLLGAPRLRVRLLMRLSLKAMAAGGGWAEPQDTVFGRFAEHLAVLLLAHDWRGRLACLWRIISPLEDVLMVPLPRALHFLYPALRGPLWVWKNLLGGRNRPAPARERGA